MEELVRTNDIVLISVIESLLKGAGILHMVVDTHMSVLEGFGGMISRRELISGLPVGMAALQQSATGQTARTAGARPNLIVIVSDDHGFEDIGCQGAKDVKTPECIERQCHRGLQAGDSHS